MPGFYLQTIDGTALQTAAFSNATGGDLTIIAAVSGQRIRVYKIYLVVTAATTLTFKDGSSNSLSGGMDLAANGSITLDFDGQPWHLTSPGNAYIINSSAATKVAGQVYFTQNTVQP